MTQRTLLLLPLLLLAACGGPDATPQTGASNGASGTSSSSTEVSAPDVLLAADLPDAVGVVAAKQVEPDSPVSVFGRVQRTAKGVFVLVDDEAVKYCGQGDATDDHCPTPWDYCCEDPDAVRESTLVVEAYDAAGEPVSKDALGIRPLDLVALEGTLKVDDAGQPYVEARSGWFRRDRPVVGLHVRFP